MKFITGQLVFIKNTQALEVLLPQEATINLTNGITMAQQDTDGIWKVVTTV